MKKNVFIPCLGLLAAFALAFIFTACDDGTTPTIDPALTGTVDVQIDGTTVEQVKVGETVTAKVTGSNASAGALRYQWQKKADGENTFSNITGAILATYFVAVEVETSIRVVVSAIGYTGNKASNAVVVKPVLAIDLTGSVAIVKEPAEDTPIRIGDTVKANVTGSNAATAALRYQWKKSNSENGTFTDIESATTQTYTINASDVAANDYIKVVVNAIGFSGIKESTAVQVIRKAPVVTSIVITADTMSVGDIWVAKDDGVQLLAAVSGTDLLNEDKGVTWSVKGYVASGTAPVLKEETEIDENGYLSVAGDEGNAILLVTATSETNTSIKGEVYIHIKFTVTLDSDGGTIGEDATLDISVEAGNLSLKFVEGGWIYSATKVGSVFIGWYVSTDTNEAVIETVNVSGDITLKAKWETGWTVTFHLDGGTYADKEDTFVITVAKESTLTLDPSYTPFKRGFAFEGWYADEDFTDDAVTEFEVTEDTDLYAKWEALGDIEDYLGVWKDADGNVYILTEWSFHYLSVDFSDYATAWSWTTSSINDKDVAFDDGTLIIDGVDFSKVTETMLPQGSERFNGTAWKKGDLTLDLDEGGGMDGSAYISTEDWSFAFGPAYLDDGTKLYLLLTVWDDNWEYDAGEVLFIIPIVDGALQGWTLVENDD
jgi:uncharacterized repeat protein (TIGR02543 family)